MSTAAMSATQLLKLDDGQFDTTIQNMSVKNLMDTISVLQKEMSREQENFNSLSSESGSLKKNSGQYKSVSKDMAASQARLTQLMDRSMKCFTQQGNQQSKAAIERRNSLKGSQPVEVQTRKSAEPVRLINQVVKKTHEETDNTKRTSGGVTANPNRTDEVTANASNPNIQVQSMTTRNSFSDLRSKFNGTNSENGVTPGKNINKINVSSNIMRSQSSVNADASKRLSDNVSSSVRADANTKSDKTKENKTVNGSKAFHLSSSSNSSSSSNKPSNTDPQLGPIASQQSRFLSKSTDNVFSKPPEQKPDVVQGFKPSKQRTMMVMNADKQVIDLDSFTDRKNMLGELKNMKKDLKQVDKTHLKSKPNEEDNETIAKCTENKVLPAKQGTLFGDIQLAKKPSELKSGKGAVVKSKQNGTIAKNYEQNDEKDKKISNNVTPGDSQMHLFDDLLNDYKDDSDKVSEDSPREVTLTPQAREVNPGNAMSGEITLSDTWGSKSVTDSSEDNLSESSGVSEDDDRFVTEFSFPQTQMKQKAALPSASVIKKSGKICFQYLVV